MGNVIKNNRIRGLKFLTFAIVVLAGCGFLVMYLWNWLVPPIFGLQMITFWQAIGLLVLSRVLFGGFRGRPGGRSHGRRHFLKRWAAMTPEERERFLSGIRQGGSTDPSPREG
jgi:hypothetical protein